jgi:hypothetical protein
VSVDLAGTGVKGGKEVERARPPVLMLHTVGQVVGLSWEGRGRGCREVFSSKESTISSARRGRV